MHNDSVIAALEAIAPYPNPDGSTPIMKVLTERRWDVALGGMLYGKTKDDEGPDPRDEPRFAGADDRTTPVSRR